MPSAAISREFVADAPGVAQADQWIEDHTGDWPDQASVVKARVCAAELAANLLEHGSDPGRPARLQIRLLPEAHGLILELSDNGHPFDPTKPPAQATAPETLQTAAIGGRGLRTVHGLARQLVYRRDAGRNHLSLRIAP